MIGLIATFAVDPARTAAFEAAVAALTAACKANEPGLQLYQLLRSRKGEGVFKMMELYATEADMKSHGRSDHFRANWPAVNACLTSPPEIEVLEAV